MRAFWVVSLITCFLKESVVFYASLYQDVAERWTSFFMGIIRDKPLAKETQFICDDFKLQMSLVALADKYSENIRAYIYKTYNDAHIFAIYRGIRNSGIYEKGSKDKTRRKILEIPNGYVMDFLTTMLAPKYGRYWYMDNKALNEPLVKPWWVVNKL